jgi:hypothetical protein
MAVQLRNQFRSEVDVDLPVGELFHSAGIRDVAALLSVQLTQSTGGRDEEVEVF